MTGCPSQEVLAAVAQGVVLESADEFAEHLEKCRDCRNRLDEFVRGSSVELLEHSTVLLRNDPNGGNEITAGDSEPVRVDSATEIEAARFPIQLGEYELLEVLGEGGMGVVYRARQAALGRVVAVKVCRPARSGTASRVARFRLEAESAARLDHPGIVPIIDVGEIGPYVYYAMGYMPGGTLAEQVSDGPLDCIAAATHVKAIAEAIYYAHERGVIHRDLKSTNILLDADGLPKVADFGLAKRIESASLLTAAGEILGTPSFMPPEQAAGQTGDVTIASDVYSLGAILYHLATGRPPFSGEDAVAVLFKVIHHEPVNPRQLNPRIPRDLDTIILRSLAKSPDGRYATAGEVAAELGRFLSGEPINARPLSRLGRLQRWCRRNPALAGMTAVVAVSLISASIVSVYFGIQARRQSAALSESNESLSIAERDARISEAGAHEQAEIAKTRTNAAMAVLETILYELQDTLTYDPEAQEDRRRLLEAALEDLEGVSDAHIEPDRLTRFRANALLGLADVAMQAGDAEGKSGSAGSRELYREAVELFRGLYAQAPDVLSNRQGLALALTEYGDTQADAGDWQTARRLFFEALPLRQQDAEARPDDLDAQRELARLEVFCAEGLSDTGERDKGRAMFEQSCERYQQLLQTAPADRRIRKGHTRACRELGDWHLASGNIDEAEARYLEFGRLTEALVKEFPLDPDLLMDQSTACERFGIVCTRRGDKVKARHQYAESLRIAQKLEATAPGNSFIQWEVSFSYQQLAGACLAVGEIAAARESAQRCVEIRQPLAAADPDNVHRHVKLFHAVKLLGQACRRGGDPSAAAECYRESLKIANGFMERTGTRRFAADADWFQQQINQLALADATK